PRTGKERPPTPLEAWRDLVLPKNKEYRTDSSTQETSAEVQLRYLRAWNAQKGKGVRRDVGAMARLLPLVPKFGSDQPRGPIVSGPSEGVGPDGAPLIEAPIMDQVLERMGLPRRRPALRPPGPRAAGPGADGMPTPVPAPVKRP